MAILTGYKSIQKYCGLTDKTTVRKWIKDYKLPVLRLGNQVCALEEEINEWFTTLRKSTSVDGKWSKLASNFSPKQTKL